MYFKKSDKPIVALTLSQLEAYAKGFGFKEIPSGLMLQSGFAEKKYCFQRARQIIIQGKELEGKQTNKGRIRNIK
jgi:hypothetical protein